MRIILASGSPRRTQLLKDAGIEHEILVSDVDETCETADPALAAEEIAARKAEAVSDMLPPGEDCLIIAADTSVILGGEVMGKPRSEGEAMNMLHKLQGKSHRVITGVSLILKEDGQPPVRDTFHEVTTVYVRAMNTPEILEYVATGEPMDKAGAYAIQGIFSANIDHIEGDYNNVVGLPVDSLTEHMYKLLKKEMMDDVR